MSQTALLLADDIVIIASGTILLIVLAIYGFVFLTHRFALDKEYELKEHYNRILQFTGAYKFKYLEILAKDNPILEQYSNNLKKNKNVFEQSLKLVQAKLMVLTSANANYHFAHTRNLIKAIEQDLEKCDTMIDYFRNVSINTTKYTKSASDILTQYRKIADHVINFYEFHLALRYDHDVINNMIKLINESFVNAFGLIKHPKNNVELIHAISELNKHTTNMYHIVGELYILDHILMFLMSRQKHLDRIMEKYSHRLSSADQYSVDRNSATAKANITNASVAIKELKFNEARNAAVIALKHFNSAISKIEMGEVTNALAQKNMSFLNAQIDILKKDLKEITIAFNNIKRFFNAKDPQITNSIYQLGAKLKNIDYFHQTLQSEFNNFENIQREDFLIKVNTLINDLMSWKVLLTNLIGLIQERYRTSININNELSEVKLILSQLLGTKLRFNSGDTKSLDGIKNIIMHIDHLQAQLANNYFANYQGVKDELEKTKEQVTLLLQASSLDETLKLYSQRIIFFLNKYRYEAKEIDRVLTLAEKYYTNGRFQESINLLIDVLSNIKESAKMSKISFS